MRLVVSCLYVSIVGNVCTLYRYCIGSHFGQQTLFSLKDLSVKCFVIGCNVLLCLLTDIKHEKHWKSVMHSVQDMVHKLTHASCQRCPAQWERVSKALPSWKGFLGSLITRVWHICETFTSEQLPASLNTVRDELLKRGELSLYQRIQQPSSCF